MAKERLPNGHRFYLPLKNGAVLRGLSGMVMRFGIDAGNINGHKWMQKPIGKTR